MHQKKSFRLFLKYGWVIGFTLLCGILFEKGMRNKETQYQLLKDQYSYLEKEKEIALVEQQNLKNQINSQSDQGWIELVLKKGLGVTPESQQKIFFDK